MNDINSKVEMKYRNFYRHCKTKWDDCWDSTCNDKCPVCGKEISPYKSEEYKEDESVDNPPNPIGRNTIEISASHWADVNILLPTTSKTNFSNFSDSILLSSFVI